MASIVHITFMFADTSQRFSFELINGSHSQTGDISTGTKPKEQRAVQIMVGFRSIFAKLLTPKW